MLELNIIRETHIAELSRINELGRFRDTN